MLILISHHYTLHLTIRKSAAKLQLFFEVRKFFRRKIVNYYYFHQFIILSFFCTTFAAFFGKRKPIKRKYQRKIILCLVQSPLRTKGTTGTGRNIKIFIIDFEQYWTFMWKKLDIITHGIITWSCAMQVLCNPWEKLNIYGLSFILRTVVGTRTEWFLYVLAATQDWSAKPSLRRWLLHRSRQGRFGEGGEKDCRLKEWHSNLACEPLPLMVLSRGGQTGKIQFFDKISTGKGTHCSLLNYFCTVFSYFARTQTEALFCARWRIFCFSLAYVKKKQ